MYKNNFFNLALALVAMSMVFTTSCDSLFSTQDRSYQDDPKVEVKPTSTSVDEGGEVEISVQLIGPQRDSDLQVNFSTSGSAESGTHYEPLGSSATISAGSSSTVITVNTNDVQDEGDSVELVIELTGTDADVGVATNVSTSTVFIDGVS